MRGTVPWALLPMQVEGRERMKLIEKTPGGSIEVLKEEWKKAVM